MATKNLPAVDPSKKNTVEDDKLKQVSIKLTNFQSELNNDELIEFAKIYKDPKNPVGLFPQTKMDVDTLTNYLNANIPTRWSKPLKAKLRLTLKTIRDDFDLNKGTNFNLILIGIILLFIIVFIVFRFLI